MDTFDATGDNLIQGDDGPSCKCWSEADSSGNALRAFLPTPDEAKE